MSSQTDSARNIKVLRYGELMMRKARDEAKPEELQEMDSILAELNLTASEAMKEVEHLVKKTY